MSRQISFVHEGSQYFTFDGSKFIRDSLGTNAATLVELTSKASFAGEMRKLNNGSPRFATEFPVVKDAVVEKIDGLFYVRGTVNLDGIDCAVTLDADGVKFAKVEAEDVTTVSEVAEEAQEEEAELVPEELLQDDDGQQEEAVEQEQNTGTSAETVAEQEDAQEKERVRQMPENVEISVSVTLPESKKEGRIVEPVITTVVEEREQPVMKKGVGFMFGNNDRKNPTGVCLGVPEEVAGCLFMGHAAVTRRSGAQLGGRQQRRATSDVLQRPTVGSTPPPKPQPVPKVETVPVKESENEVVGVIKPAVPLTQPTANESLDTSWAPKETIGNREPSTPKGSFFEDINARRRANLGETDTEKRTAPLPIVQETPDLQIPDKDKDELKKEVRAKFSPEVNKVIGDIPHDMLGTIDEFTTNPVDVEELNSTGNLYCMDRRWHKAGNWFCIDVIPDNARYFYNARIGVSMQIQLTDLHAWLEAIK